MDALKDQLFNRKTVSLLAHQIHNVYDSFDVDSFTTQCLKQFPPLELKQRMSHVERMLEVFLPVNYETAIDILSDTMAQATASHFIYGAVLEFIEKQGCNDQFIDLSLQKLGEFTSKMSAEFAIRTFLNQYPSRTMDYVMEWALSEDPHQRRLASEGTRPSLPWAQKISIDYQDASIALDYLFYDKVRYVTRSVANHLNDISKIDPDFVLHKLREWTLSKKQNAKEMAYITQHSLRTLIKQGHPGTIQFLGYKANPNIEILQFTLSNDIIQIGDTQEFELIIHAKETTKLLIDFIVTYPTKFKKASYKVYKLMTVDAQAGKVFPIKGRRKFEHLSTRQMNTGIHRIDIQINGEIYVSQEFTLIDKEGNDE